MTFTKKAGNSTKKKGEREMTADVKIDKPDMIVITTLDALPDHCYECPCHDGECGYCQADKERRYSDYRPYWCPLKKIYELKKQRPTGHWIVKKDWNGYYGECSNCHKEQRAGKTKYCSYCGADMCEPDVNAFDDKV